MTRVFIRGIGAVSPAGWGVPALSNAMTQTAPMESKPLPGPGREYRARVVPPPASRSGLLAHPRLRRASGISQYAIAAAQEALGQISAQNSRLGIVAGSHVASIRYTERFFAEALRDPSTASPLLFPETVVNASASHLAAALGPSPLTYSLLGDQTVFFQALVTGAMWLAQDRADFVIVVGAEECGWNIAEAIHLFAKDVICGEGAGALLLSREPGPGRAVELESISDPQIFAGAQRRPRLALPNADIVCDSASGAPRWDAAPPRENVISPRRILGEALAAGTAWQFVLAVDALREERANSAAVVTVGSNHQAIHARLIAG